MDTNVLALPLVQQYHTLLFVFHCHVCCLSLHRPTRGAATGAEIAKRHTRPAAQQPANDPSPTPEQALLMRIIHSVEQCTHSLVTLTDTLKVRAATPLHCLISNGTPVLAQPLDDLRDDIDFTAGALCSAEKKARTALGVQSKPPLPSTAGRGDDTSEQTEATRHEPARGGSKRKAGGKPVPARRGKQATGRRSSLAASRGPARRASAARG